MAGTTMTTVDNKGFTLVELIVVMAVFIVVLAIASETFLRVVTLASRFSKSEESNIEGVIGLEVMRHDLESMGFGLPWGFCQPASTTDDGACVGTTVEYSEATANGAKLLNDGPVTGLQGAGNPPRAFVTANVFGSFTSNYFAVKATSVGRSKAANKWTYIPFNNLSSAAGWSSVPVTFAGNNPTATDRVILIRSNFNTPSDDHLLMVSPSGSSNFFSSFNYFENEVLPKNDQQTHMVYGVDSNTGLRMPFNRADFYVSTAGTVPSFCAERTGVLYKKTVNQGDGAYTSIPLLDCVADMQVILGWDTSDGGNANSVNAYSTVLYPTSGVFTASPATASGDIQTWLSSAQGIREHLKIVKIFILAQEGKRDSGYTFPNANMLVGSLDHGASFTHTYIFSDEQRHYRWKLYRIVVRPKNLSSNQR